MTKGSKRRMEQTAHRKLEICNRYYKGKHINEGRDSRNVGDGMSSRNVKIHTKLHSGNSKR